MKAGEEFVKMIRPFGCFLFLAASVLILFLCLTSGRDPIPGYESPHDTAYYAEHADGTEKLIRELNENVFPELDGITDCYAAADGTVVIVIEADSFAISRSAILRYFDESLFEFKEG